MIRSRTYIAVPPGETIKEQLLYRGMTQKEFAARMDMSEKHISQLIKGDVHITSNTALRLEMVLGLPSNFWESLESLYKEDIAKVNDENQIDFDIEILKQIPYKEMVRHGWIDKAGAVYDRVVAVRKFFEVTKLSLLKNPRINQIVFRCLSDNDDICYTLITWTQKAKLDARNVATKPINIKGLISAIPQIRQMSILPPEKFCPKLADILSENGVALVLLPHLKKSFLHGASFYDGKKIVLGLTVRGKYADRFWFSLFHEIAHIIYGHIGQPNGTSKDDELLADKFARDTLIPENSLHEFIKQGTYTEQSLRQFAESINIDTGILIGRLQTDKVIKYDCFNYLKKKYALK